MEMAVVVAAALVVQEVERRPPVPAGQVRRA
jgi:hypothetical protein